MSLYSNVKAVIDELENLSAEEIQEKMDDGFLERLYGAMQRYVDEQDGKLTAKQNAFETQTNTKIEDLERQVRALRT